MFGKIKFSIQFRKVEKNIEKVSDLIGYKCTVISDEWIYSRIYEIAAKYNCDIIKLNFDSWDNKIILKCKKKNKNKVISDFILLTKGELCDIRID